MGMGGSSICTKVSYSRCIMLRTRSQCETMITRYAASVTGAGCCRGSISCANQQGAADPWSRDPLPANSKSNRSKRCQWTSAKEPLRTIPQISATTGGFLVQSLNFIKASMIPRKKVTTPTTTKKKKTVRATIHAKRWGEESGRSFAIRNSKKGIRRRVL